MADGAASTAAFGVSLAALISIASCKGSSGERVAEANVWEHPQDDPALESGRQVWTANCKRCHAFGIEGAPRIGDHAVWSERSKKGVAALTRSVIEGVLSKSGGEMPPRAGNEKLTDAEIEAAVSYVLAVSDRAP
jgi:cytochrome c5